MTPAFRAAAAACLAAVLAGPALAEPAVRVWVTDPFSAGVRLQEQAPVPGAPGAGGPAVLTVDPGFRDQSVGGFGASLTESAALVLGTLAPGDRDELLAELFAPGRGLALNFLRQPIGATDFSASVFSCDDVAPGETDFGLERFTLARDRAAVLPLLRRIRDLQPGLLVAASPWSPPAWMKTGGTMLGATGGVLREDCYDVYARYLARFVREYAAEGIPVFALTAQNEPAYAPPLYPGMAWPAADAARFLREDLGPVLAREAPGTLLWGWDHNYDGAGYARELLADPETARWLAGTAWHSYGGTAASLDGLRRDHPGYEVWMTEGGLGAWQGGFRAQFQAGIRQGIAALAHGSRSYVLWNLALDRRGGPVVYPNSVNEGLVTVDGGRVVSRNAGYYVLGHFTRAVVPGARRIGLEVPPGGPEGAAFENPDGSWAVVLANPYLNDQTVRLTVRGRPWDLTVPGMGAVTFLETP